MEPAAGTEPARPATIPESSVWNASLAKWEASERGADGVKAGDCRLFRPDGTLYSRTRFVGGVEDGPFAVYHPDGRVAREGRFVGGKLDGLVTAYAAPGRAGEPLRVCCVPPRAARLDLRYRAGDLLLEVFFDGEGRAILSDGAPCPPRPMSLPELAGFNEARGGWTLSEGGVDRFWTAEGALVEEVELPYGGGRVVRLLDGDGGVREEHRFDKDDKRTGPFRRRFAPDAPSHLADARVREERGAFDRGQMVGRWTYLDEHGAVVAAAERGPAVTAAFVETSPAFAETLGDGWALARALDAEGRVREALTAAARAAVADRDGAALRLFIDERIVAPPEALRAEWGEALARAGDADLPTILDGLVRGTDPAAVFRALAAVLPATSGAAAELVEASLLLAPERRMTHVTRALLRMQRGDEAGARADADIVAGESREAADSLLTFLRVTFRPFEAAAVRGEVEPDPDLDELAPPIAQDLEAVRRIAAVYATRLGRLRAAILALHAPGGADGAAPAPPWLPPDLFALLPDGPVALRRERILCDEPTDGGERDTVEVDEEVATDGLPVPVLLGLAQADFGALAWLCWAVGLEGFAVPDAIRPPAELGAAMKMIVRRHWRANDRLTTGGLLALTNRIPGFSWQGIDIDAVPTHLVQTVAAEYSAARSMFLWLVSPDTLTPFQDDLRDA